MGTSPFIHWRIQLVSSRAANLVSCIFKSGSSWNQLQSTLGWTCQTKGFFNGSPNQYLPNCFNASVTHQHHQIKRFFAQEHTQHHLSESRQVHSTVRLALGISPQLLYLRNIPCHMPWPWHRLTMIFIVTRSAGGMVILSQSRKCPRVSWLFGGLVSWNGGTPKSSIYRLIFH